MLFFSVRILSRNKDIVPGVPDFLDDPVRVVGIADLHREPRVFVHRRCAHVDGPVGGEGGDVVDLGGENAGGRVLAGHLCVVYQLPGDPNILWRFHHRRRGRRGGRDVVGRGGVDEPHALRLILPAGGRHVRRWGGRLA
ncbi:hypothetical protein, partial [Methanoculleus chikugoensis]|uniref:hypothetical protein n=1 Tax=Methanoculleus chikugoensis TaxID=118126 RepID=UPI001FB363FD